ncbi:mucin-3A [Esox lucius]|uniref:mucin-3A n=1 Tax=Esox lucius TaxID=8010 RepID=UPI001477443F|nr:mucin-3A [Esox lucius]
MAISKNKLSVFVILMACYILKTQELIDISSLISQVFNTKENPHYLRGKRAVPVSQWTYIIDIEVNVSAIETIQQIKSAVNSTSLPYVINNTTEISEIDITTVCSLNGTGFQCRCENQYQWSCDQCLTYGRCDDTTSDTCGCINAIPSDGMYCQSVLQQNFTACSITTASPTTDSTVPPTLYMYMIEIELNLTDVAAINTLRTSLRNASYPVIMNSLTQITGADITTVCSLNGTGFQCRCENQYQWSCDQCLSYGRCDDTTSDTCGCINAIPSDGMYCQSVLQQNFTACPTTTVSPTTDLITSATTEQNNTAFPTSQVITVTNATTFEPTIQLTTVTNATTLEQTTQLTTVTNSTVPPTLYMYMIEIELNLTDVAAINTLRTSLGNASYPVIMNRLTQITGADITTVCSLNGTGFQCRCENQYQWSCDQCLSYGRCDDTTSDTCGCINAIPSDGMYCQSVLQQNFTACPTTTVSPTTDLITSATTEQNNTAFPTSQVITVTNATTFEPTIQLTTVTNATTLEQTTQLTTVTNSTGPPTIYMYMIEIELNITDVAAINTLRAALGNASYPVTMNSLTQITGVIITTVCSLNGTGFQCRCENQYQWSCDQCLSYGRCDDTTSDTCGCINAVPSDGMFCQSVLQQNFTACPTTTASPTTDATTLEQTTQFTTVTNATTFEPTTQLTPATNATTPFEPTTQLTPATNATTFEPTTQLTPATNATTPFEPTTQLTPATNATTPFEPTTQLTPATNATTPFEPTTQLTPATNATTFEPTTQLTPATNATTPFEPTTQLTPATNATTPFEPTTQLTPATSANTFQPTTQLTPATNATTPFEPTTQLTPATNATTPFEPTTQLTPATNATTPFEPTTQLTPATNATTPFEPTTQLTPATNATTPFEPTTQLTPATSNTTTTTPAIPLKITLLTISFKLNDIFTADLMNESSSKYLKYKNDIQPVIQAQYQSNLPGFISAALTGFRPGSVIVGFSVLTTGANQTEINNANNGLATSLPAAYQVILNSFVVVSNDTSTTPPTTTTPMTTTATTTTPTTTPKPPVGVLPQINNLLTNSVNLPASQVAGFVAALSDTSSSLQSNITSSPINIASIVNILSNIAEISKNISAASIKNILQTVDILVSDDASGAWKNLNDNTTQNTSSSLLGALETFASVLPAESFNLTTKTIQLNITLVNTSFNAFLNSSVQMNITANSTGNIITTMTFSTLQNVLPPRNARNDSLNDTTINGKVVLVKFTGRTDSVSLTFSKLEQNLTVNPQCVFWNFSFFDNRGAWDNEGCSFKSDMNGKVSCFCNHLTSFSILMSTSIPESIAYALDLITYIGVGISMGSLVVCLIIEACVWKAMTRNNTAYMRHVSIVNIAVSLLIADIWFIIGASLIKADFQNPNETTTDVPACTAATFFIHFFYLALFFWMLISGLLLFYRTILVFSHMSKSTMLAIGFSVGYGAPLIIAVVTIASTAGSGGYINGNKACWLNWDKTKALLAFVIPALAIVFINFLILIVVLYKMLRRGVGDTSQQNDRNAAVIIARCLAILTPLFGLTWGLGVGTMFNPTNEGIQIVFALFNSLQGFFILVFGTLLDGKIRAALATTFSSISSSSDRTRSTSADAATSSSSTSALDLLRRRIRRNAYNVSEAANSSSSNAVTESFINT